MRDYKIIGLTGPTGSGKSSICNILKENANVAIIDTDKIARLATYKESSCYYTLGAVFGKEIYDIDGNINRQKLANIAFLSKENTKKLNDIVHPWVFLKTFEQIKIHSNNNAKLIFIDAPVLIESNANFICDYVLSVICPLEIRLKRIIKRDNITKENALKRIEAQNDDDFYINSSDFVIDGSITFDKLKIEVDKFLTKLNEVNNYVRK